MNNIFSDFKNKEGPWFSEIIQVANGTPLSIRVMNNIEAEFHTHKSTDELFLVVSGKIIIDTENESIELKEGQSYTVRARIRHRARAIGRAELLVFGGHNT